MMQNKTVQAILATFLGGASAISIVIAVSAFVAFLFITFCCVGTIAVGERAEAQRMERGQ